MLQKVVESSYGPVMHAHVTLPVCLSVFMNNFQLSRIMDMIHIRLCLPHISMISAVGQPPLQSAHCNTYKLQISEDVKLTCESAALPHVVLLSPLLLPVNIGSRYGHVFEYDVIF